MTDKTKSQTYNFLSENKSIEDIKKQPNTTFKAKSRHGGKTFKIIEKNNETNNTLVNNELSENEIFYDTYDTVDDLNDILAEKISKLQTTIQEQTQEIQQLKKENEKLKLKQSNVNFDKFKYNAVTIYDEKQRKKTGIEKIHEEILPINNELYFITTIQNLDNSINEEVMHFQQFQNGAIKIFKQNKQYNNINDYKKNILLINKISANNINYSQFVLIKDFLKKHNDIKLKPTKTEISKWVISILIPIILITIALIHTSIFIISLSLGIISISLKGIVSIFSPTTQKVETWIKNKLNINKEQKEKSKKERESTIKNLISDKIETKLQTQYDILKQELENKKYKNPNELISTELINHNSNNLIENSTIKSENNQNFDSSIKNTVNQQMQKPSTSSNHNWNKVKCLLTT